MCCVSSKPMCVTLLKGLLGHALSVPSSAWVSELIIQRDSQVPSVSTRVQGEHSPLPSSKCGDPSLPSAHHPPALAGAQPLSEAMCLPPSVSSSGQQLQFQIPAPLQPQAPLATAGSSGGQGGFKKGLKAKWMQDTELDRTRKERDDEEVGSMKLHGFARCLGVHLRSHDC